MLSSQKSKKVKSRLNEFMDSQDFRDAISRIVEEGFGQMVIKVQDHKVVFISQTINKRPFNK